MTVVRLCTHGPRRANPTTNNDRIHAQQQAYAHMCRRRRGGGAHPGVRHTSGEASVGCAPSRRSSSSTFLRWMPLSTPASSSSGPPARGGGRGGGREWRVAQWGSGSRHAARTKLAKQRARYPRYRKPRAERLAARNRRDERAHVSRGPPLHVRGGAHGAAARATAAAADTVMHSPIAAAWPRSSSGGRGGGRPAARDGSARGCGGARRPADQRVHERRHRRRRRLASTAAAIRGRAGAPRPRARGGGWRQRAPALLAAQRRHLRGDRRVDASDGLAQRAQRRRLAPGPTRRSAARGRRHRRRRRRRRRRRTRRRRQCCRLRRLRGPRDCPAGGGRAA